MTLTLSPKELASAVGSSESSMKRWIDMGKVRAFKTVGGHRRVTLPEAVRFIRESKLTLVRPEILGMNDLKSVAGQIPAMQDAAEQLFGYLREGQASEARGFIMSLYLSGVGVADICDGPVRESMSEIGKVWNHGMKGVFIEHRATELCIQGLQQLMLSLEIGHNAPLALGGCVAGDPYVLPSLCTAAVLAAEGFRTVNLGPDCPAEAIQEGAEAYRPVLCWMSVSRMADRADFRGEIKRLAERLHARGIVLALGGRELHGVVLGDVPGVFVGQSMKELVSFARGLRMSQGAAVGD